MPETKEMHYICNNCAHIETTERDMDGLWHEKCGGRYRKYDWKKELNARVDRSWLDDDDPSNGRVY